MDLNIFLKEILAFNKLNLNHSQQTEQSNEMSVITEQSTTVVNMATNPSGTIPVIGTVGIANWFGGLPEIINVMTLLYLSLLVIHKAYSMYVEWKNNKKGEV